MNNEEALTRERNNLILFIYLAYSVDNFIILLSRFFGRRKITFSIVSLQGNKLILLIEFVVFWYFYRNNKWKQAAASSQISSCTSGFWRKSWGFNLSLILCENRIFTFLSHLRFSIKTSFEFQKTYLKIVQSFWTKFWLNLKMKSSEKRNWFKGWKVSGGKSILHILYLKIKGICKLNVLHLSVDFC